MVAEVEHLALDKAWLDRNGHTIVHRNWFDLNIVRLSGSREEATNRSGEVWTAKELEALENWDVPDRILAKRLGRTKAAVSVRRSMLRRKFNSQLLKNKGLAPISK
jgi:hypothetical protein